MSVIKDFFNRQLMKAKFKQAGEGHKLTEPTRKLSQPPTRSLQNRTIPSDGAQRAGAAALARFEQKPQPPTMANRSQNAIRAEALRQLELERQAAAAEGVNCDVIVETETPYQEVVESAPVLSVNGVFYHCPLVGPDVLPWNEIHKKIQMFLYEQEEERGLTACLIIHTCNTNKDKVAKTVETLVKYFDNLINSPTEEKYRKIRVNNKIFQDRVAGQEGTNQVLLAAGFELAKVKPSDDAEPEDFYIYPEEKLDQLETVQILRDALLSAEPIVPELDRSVKVLAVMSSAGSRFSLPPEFYNITPEELKREQQLRLELVEKNQMLRTKAMRDREELREQRRYKYALLRIRFPDGILLQGTFAVNERLEAVYEFTRDHLADRKSSFLLRSGTGLILTEMDKSLLELKLIPAVVLNFSFDSMDATTDNTAQASGASNHYLDPESMILLQEL